MSSITFHSQEAEAVLYGFERYYASYLISRTTLAALSLEGLGVRKADHLRPLIRRGHYSLEYRGDAFARILSTAVSVMDDVFEGVETFTLALNTGIVMGGRVMKLLARLHGQCEIHCYVEGPNREWLAGIIDEGIASGLLRKRGGWLDVHSLLLSASDGPVVMSFSVTEGFPNESLAEEAGWDSGGVEDAFYELSDEQQWHYAITALRAQGGGLEMRPENWEDFRFGDGLNAFSLMERLQDNEGSS